MLAAPNTLRDLIAECKAKPEGIPDQHFVCLVCLKAHPISEIGARYGYRKTAKTCKACLAKKPPLPSRKRNVARQTQKKYRAGKLPKWMFF